jgi:hypothetical protein
VNFGERGKSSGRHSLTSMVKPVLIVSLAKVDYGCVYTWSRGPIGFIGEVFGVMAQVDLGLTGV